MFLDRRVQILVISFLFVQIGWGNQARYELAKSMIDKSLYTETINLCIGEANKVIPTLPHGIDFSFIDADKKQKQNYFDLLLPKLSDHALVVVDDVLMV